MKHLSWARRSWRSRSRSWLATWSWRGARVTDFEKAVSRKRRSRASSAKSAIHQVPVSLKPKRFDQTHFRPLHPLTFFPFNSQASTPTNPLKSFTSCGQNSSAQLPFMNYSHDFSSIQPIYSLDSLSHDSGFKTGSSSNSAEHDELLKIMTELEEAKLQYVNEHLMVSELEQQLAVLSQENQSLQSRLVQANTLDEMKSVHEELSFLEEVRQGQMCTRCLKNFDCRMVPTENTSYIGTEGDEDDDRSLLDLLNNTATHTSQPIFRSTVTIKVNSMLANFIGFIPFGESFIWTFLYFGVTWTLLPLVISCRTVEIA